MNPKQVPPGLFTTLTGRCFVHPLLDYLLIGGGLSLLVTAIVVLTPMRSALLGTGAAMAGVLLFRHGGHFGGCTVRLVTKAGRAGAPRLLLQQVPPTVLI